MSGFELEYQLLDGGQAKLSISAQPLVIGRTAAANIVVGWDRSISGRHFQISAEGERLILTDLQSTNGTFVNGDRITEHQVQIGDQIRAGNTTFQVRVAQKTIPRRDPKLTPDSILLSESDFNVPNADSPIPFHHPSPSPESEKAKSAPSVTSLRPIDAAAHAASMANLLAHFSWTRGDGSISEARLVPGEILEIGRAPENKICLAHDPYVSWKHCSIEWRVERCLLTDRHSFGGTRVDGVHQFAHCLAGVGSIRVGGSEISFRVSGVPTTPDDNSAQNQIARDLAELPKSVVVAVETCLSGLQRVRVSDEGSGKKSAAKTAGDAQAPKAKSIQPVGPLFQKFLKRLPNHHAIFVVDFSRLGELPPIDLDLIGSSPFAELGEPLARNFPLVLTTEEFVQWPILDKELWEHDNCYVLFTELPKVEVVARLAKLRHSSLKPSRVPVPPTSLGIFWPSVLDAILFANPQQLMDKFTELCSLVYMGIPNKPGLWQIYGRSTVIDKLLADKFFQVLPRPTRSENDAAESPSDHKLQL